MSETRVWIAQCLCGPARHCILATAGEADSVATATTGILDPLQQSITDWVRSGLFNPWCGLCHAEAAGWQYELGRTPFRTMEEAAPTLRQNEAEQAATRAALGDMKRSD